MIETCFWIDTVLTCLQNLQKTDVYTIYCSVSLQRMEELLKLKWDYGTRQKGRYNSSTHQSYKYEVPTLVHKYKKEQENKNDTKYASLGNTYTLLQGE